MYFSTYVPFLPSLCILNLNRIYELAEHGVSEYSQHIDVHMASGQAITSSSSPSQSDEQSSDQIGK